MQFAGEPKRAQRPSFGAVDTQKEFGEIVFFFDFLTPLSLCSPVFAFAVSYALHWGHEMHL